MRFNSKSLLRLILLFSLCFVLLCNFAYPVKSDELSDLNNQIQQKQREKDETLKKIQAIENSIKDITSSKKTVADQYSILTSQQQQLATQIVLLDNQITDLEKNIVLFTDRLSLREQDIKLKINYLTKLTYEQPNLLSSEKDMKQFFTNLVTSNTTISFLKSDIKGFNQKLALAQASKEQIKKDRETATKAGVEIEKALVEIQHKLNEVNNQLAAASGARNDLQQTNTNLTSQLGELSARQNQLIEQEKAKMDQDKQSEQKPVETGTYYFIGKGRYIAEGHGLGLSQWGAYGMAQKGWNYNQILKFYYSGVTIADYQEPEYIVVDGKTGPIPFDEYLAGIGEVPNSWPVEAIKAQIVAARTYVLKTARKGSDNYYHICSTTSCQVYLGGTAKMQYVKETKGKVILYDGQPIAAFYGASARGYTTSQSDAWGCGDAALTSKSCDKAYLKPVNDDAYAYKDYLSSNPYYDSSCKSNCQPQYIKPYSWEWRTNGYTKAQLTDIFSRSSSLNVGNVQSINLKKDISGRVSRVTIKGDKGQKILVGSDFRSIFNITTTYNDYVYSNFFDFVEK